MTDLTTDPRLHEAHQLYVQGKYPEASLIYRDLVGAYPQHWGIRYALGSCLIGLGQREQAIAHLMLARTLNPGSILPHLELTRVYSLLEKYPEARASVEQALALEPESKTALAFKADLLSVVGETDAAAEIAIRLLDGGIAEPAIAAQVAPILAKVGRRDDAIVLLQGVTPEGAPPAPAVINCLFALGEQLDKAKRYDEAWSAYERGNRLARSPFDSAQHAASVDAIVRNWTRESLAPLPSSEHPGANHVFIVGMPRSGTSLVEQILASHPEVAPGGERPTIARIARTLRGGPDAQHSYFLESPAPLSDPAVVARHAGELQVSVPPAARAAARFTDKMPGNWRTLGIVQSIAPGARVVWCRRDAMDNCLSCYFQHFYGPHPWCYDLISAARVYRDHERLMNHWQSVLDIPILEMSYEEMVADQEAQSRRLIDFVGLEWDDACLSFHKTERVVRTRSMDQVRQPIYRSSMARWRHYESHLGTLKRALEGGESLYYE